jgi:hypothetical protein
MQLHTTGIRATKLVLLSLFAAGGGQPAWAQDNEFFRELPRATAPAKSSARAAVNARAVRSRDVAVDMRVLPGSSEPEARVVFNLFPDVSIAAYRTRSYSIGDGEASIWSGEIDGVRGSQVTLALRDGLVTGNIRTAEGEFYRIRPQPDGTHRIEQIDSHAVLIDDDAPEPPSYLVPLTESGKSSPRLASAGANEATGSTIDVMVVYTPEARQAAGGATAMRNLIDLTIAEANQGFVNSGINIMLRLVHAAEAAPASGQAASSAYLNQVTDDASIIALRDRYGADAISVWVNGPGANGGVVGIGWLMTRPSAAFAPAAFSAVEVNFADGPSYTFAHELGHNLGSAHDRANSGSQGAYPYAYGYQQPLGTTAERFVTIMAYRNGCSGCSRINHWSNPDVNYAGRPTGVPISQPTAADNRTTLNNTRVFAEQWRPTVVNPPPPPPPPTPAAPVAVSVSPSAGTGTDSTFTATYSDGNGAADIAEAYLLVQTGLAQASACQVMVRQSDRTVWLRNDAGTGWAGSAAIGSSTVLANSQCRVTPSGASLTAAGNTLTFRAPVSFLQAAFRGLKDLNLRALDRGGLDSGWQKLGTWTIPDPPPPTSPVAPSVISISPNAGQGLIATFTAVVEDLNGASEITPVLFLVNDRLAATSSCYIYLLPRSRTVYLATDSASSWHGPANGQGTLANSQCSIDVSGLTVTSSGNRMSVRFPLRFQSRFAGTKGLFLAVGDTTGRFSRWTQAGSWDVR